jgi:hypothetical protein
MTIEKTLRFCGDCANACNKGWSLTGFSPVQQWQIQRGKDKLFESYSCIVLGDTIKDPTFGAYCECCGAWPSKYIAYSLIGPNRFEWVAVKPEYLR